MEGRHLHYHQHQQQHQHQHQQRRQVTKIGEGGDRIQVTVHDYSGDDSDGFPEIQEAVGPISKGTRPLDQHSATKIRRGTLRKKPVIRIKPRHSSPIQDNDAYDDDDRHHSGHRNSQIMAAAALLAKFVPAFLPDLCQPCSQIVQHRINSIASGELVLVDDGATTDHLSFVGDELTGESYTAHIDSENTSFSSGRQGNVREHSERRISSRGLPGDSRRLRYTSEDIIYSLPQGQEDTAESLWAEASEDFGNDVALRSQDSVGLESSETSMVEQEVEYVDKEVSSQQRTTLSRDQREQIRLLKVEREKDFIYLEHVNGRICNTVEGLELHRGIFSAAEQKRLINCIYELRENYEDNKSDEGSILSKSIGRGINRVTIQFGKSCQYSLIEHGEITTNDPIPNLLQIAIRRLVKWEVLPQSSMPDSCTIIFHEEGDSILPQTRHQAVPQPTCILPLLSDCEMFFGYKLKVLDSGEKGGLPITLPRGSVLVLNGSVAELAKHGMLATSSKRVSLVFQKVSFLNHFSAAPSRSLSGDGVQQQGSVSFLADVKYHEIVREKTIRELSVSTTSPQFSSSSPGNGMVSALPSSKENRTTSNHKVASSIHGYENGQRVDDHSSSFIEKATGEKSIFQSSTGSSLSWADCAESMGKEFLEQEENQLSRVTKEHVRFLQVGRKKDFVCLERINGKEVNIVQGLELHTNVFDAEEQRQLVDFIYDLQERGRRGEFRGGTYSEPRKWMRGKGRVTIQFGCCYNYAVDKHGNPPGIIRDDEVDPIPESFRSLIKRLVRWHVLPRTCIPDSCIVNIYDVGDCIPPHIDHHDFSRPFCTVSFLSECNVVFGSNLKIIGSGEFEGSLSFPLPVGSVLVLNGNGADVAKHCIPAVPTKRISITFRKMDPAKVPYGFSPDLDLLNIDPLSHGSSPSARMKEIQSHLSRPNLKPGPPSGNVFEVSRRRYQNWNSDSSFSMEMDFPPLESSRLNEKKFIQSRGSR